MDVANMLSNDPPHPLRSQQSVDATQGDYQRSHQYPTRHSVMASGTQPEGKLHGSALHSFQNGNASHNINAGNNASQAHCTSKNIIFQLLFDESTNYRARLPMRVGIWPHDTTESISAAVRDFFGLYDGAAKGVSFEDDQGNTLIARYENFTNNMIVHVRVQTWPLREQIQGYAATPMNLHRTPHLEAGFEMMLPQSSQSLNHGTPISRPPSALARKQSASPGMRRSGSLQKRSGAKSREDSFQAGLDQHNQGIMRDGSSSDGEGGSVTSSRRARNETLATAEISTENIVAGGRRQRAKFESSELPLFVPPQVPAPNSISSISPQRRSNGQDNPSPFARPQQRPFGYAQPLESPHQYSYGVENPYGISPASSNLSRVQAGAQHSHRLRDRVNPPGPMTRLSAGSAGPHSKVHGYGILPTPDPTIASCISDEDVALQLMRLGDASNFSSHGRTSASTLDDTLSGRADMASSVSSDEEEGEEDETETPLRRSDISRQSALVDHRAGKPLRQNVDGLPSSDPTGPSDIDEDYEEGQGKAMNTSMKEHSNKRQKLSGSKATASTLKGRNINPKKPSNKNVKGHPQITSKKTKPSLAPAINVKTAMSPPALPQHSRKSSLITSTTPTSGIGGDDDLSTKPRCQRCRKSKKGCDRQRPCQRCVDAGIGIEGCVSEDEGNGRKGRFGRHMGVSLKGDVAGDQDEEEEAGTILDDSTVVQEKNKKRKRVA